MDTHLADFTILTPEQIKHIQSVEPAMLSFMIQHEDTTEVYINGFLKVPQQNSVQDPEKHPELHSFQTSTGPTQRSAQKNDKKVKRSSWNSTIILPDIV